MKICYYKGCTFESILFEEINIRLLSGFLEDEEKVLWKDHWEYVKTVSLKLFDKVGEDQIRSFYSYYVHTDYEQPITASVAEMKEDVKKYISNLTYEDDKISDLFFVIQDLIQYFPNVGKERSYSCETCGDSNYSHDINIGV